MSVSLPISLICTGYISKLKYSQLSTTFVGEMIEVPLFDLKCVLQLSPHTLTHTHSHAHTQCRTQIQLCQSAFSTFAFSRGGREAWLKGAGRGDLRLLSNVSDV